WETAFGLAPEEGECRELADFLVRQREILPAPAKDAGMTADDQALASLCQVLFETNRFLYVD
ncbi:MAG: hypothetical protein KDM91_01070, partial [Verrucomicrobiae bacterium]|nr:hypothetical protein [Verrucomicrobiae bacterium]